jgi:hypothetical protein
MGAESLAMVLVMVAVLISFVSFIGAHNTPLSLPDFSRFGCLTSVGLIVAALVISSYEPISELNACASECDAAVGGDGAVRDELAVLVTESNATFQSCLKGAKEAEKRREKEGGIKVDDESSEETEARCRAHAVTLCTRGCVAPESGE